MKKQVKPLLLPLFLLLMSACQPNRIEAVTSLKLEINQSGMALSARAILAGESISLTIANLTPESCTLLLSADAVTDLRTAIPTKTLLFQTTSPANQTIMVTFTAPRAAGTYTLTLFKPSQDEAMASVKITVVQPGYAR